MTTTVTSSRLAAIGGAVALRDEALQVLSDAGLRPDADWLLLNAIWVPAPVDFEFRPVGPAKLDSQRNPRDRGRLAMGLAGSRLLA